MGAFKLKEKQSRLTDNEVVDRILHGESSLYEILIRRYNEKLYRVIRSYLKDEEEVEDAMQNAYLYAFEKLYQYKGQAQFSTWLVRIGINESLSRLKKLRKQAMINERSTSFPDRKLMLIPDDWQLNPEQKTVNDEMNTLLERAIDELPEKYRVVYMLREIEGMSMDQIAQCLDISESNAKVRLHRSRALLKEILYKSAAGIEVFRFGFDRCDRMTMEVMERVSKALD